MERWVRVDDLVDAQGVADRLGFAHRQNVDNLLTRCPDFPKPLGMWGRVRLWSWPDVETWAKANGRLK